MLGPHGPRGLARLRARAARRAGPVRSSTGSSTRSETPAAAEEVVDHVGRPVHHPAHGLGRPVHDVVDGRRSCPSTTSSSVPTGSSTSTPPTDDRPAAVLRSPALRPGPIPRSPDPDRDVAVRHRLRRPGRPSDPAARAASSAAKPIGGRDRRGLRDARAAPGDGRPPVPVITGQEPGDADDDGGRRAGRGGGELTARALHRAEDRRERRPRHRSDRPPQPARATRSGTRARSRGRTALRRTPPSSRRAAGTLIGFLYDRAAVITSKESATLTIRAAREISSPPESCG